MAKGSYKKEASLVVLTDSLYLPGTIKTVSSWDSHNKPLPLVVITTDNAVIKNEFIASRSQRFVLLNPETYADIQPYKKRRSMRHAKTFYKFEAFSDFGYDRNIFLDSDILCLRPTPELLANDSFQIRAATDSGFTKTRAYKGHENEINTGVLVIHKSIQGDSTVEELHSIACENPGRGGYNAGDQGIINKWIHQNSIKVDLLSPEYNLLKKDYHDFSGVDTCRLLHFAAGKPWIQQTEPNGNPKEKTPLELLWHNTPYSA